MIHSTLDHWPLVISVVSARMTLDAYLDSLVAWNRWFDRNAPFGVLRMFTSAEALVHPEGGARQAKQWMQDNGPRMRQTVICLASIVPVDQYERMKKMDLERAFGVPAGMFSDVTDALAWLGADAFRHRGLVFDPAAVQDGLAQLIAP